jgi:hypothetical protein
LSTTIDAANRANGAVNAGAGASIWRPDTYDGSAGNLDVIDNQIGGAVEGATQATVFTFGPDFDIGFDLTKSAGGLDVVGNLTSIGPSWNGIFLDIDAPGNAGVWSLNTGLAGETSEFASDTYEGGSVGAPGTQVRWRRASTTIEAYLGTTGDFSGWTFIVSGTDPNPATLNVNGALAFILSSTTARIDNITDLSSSPVPAPPRPVIANTVAVMARSGW